MIRRRRRPHAGTSVTRSSTFEKTTLATEIARHLREAIIRGELAPGERVNELKLTRTLALSRSPVRAALRADAFEPWHRASLRFHDGLVALAANRHLARLHEELKVSLRRYQISIIRLPGQPERSQAEHESILDALEQRRVDQGVALVTAHITNLKEAVLKAMA